MAETKADDAADSLAPASTFSMPASALMTTWRAELPQKLYSC
jgi:hypothetical protein